MQGLELFSVLGKLVLDKSGFDSDVKQADESGKNLAENLTSYMEKAKKVIKGVFTAVAVKKAASFIWDLANNTATAGDRIDKTSQSLGMSRKAFQEWDYILSQSGASIDSMGMTMKTLTESIATNSAETAAGLSKLGLSAAQLQSMSAEEQFETLVKAFQEMPEGVEKSRLAVQLFGRGAQSLMPLLNSASGTVDDLRQRAHDLGLVMSDDDVDAAVNFGDALADLQSAWTAIQQKFGAQMLPTFTKGLIAAANALGRISNAVSDAFATGDWSGVFSTITEEISNLLPGLIDTVVDIATGIFENADKIIDLAVSIIEGLADGLVKALPKLIAKLPDIGRRLLQGFLNIGTSLGNGVIDVINGIFGTNFPHLDKIRFPTWEEVKTAFEAAWKLIKSGAEKLMKLVFGEDENGGIKWPTWEEIKEKFTDWWDNTFVPNAKKAMVWVLKLFGMPEESAEKISSVVTGWWTTVKTAVQDAIGWVLKLPSMPPEEAGAELKRIVSEWWGGVVDTVSGVLNWILGVPDDPGEDGASSTKTSLKKWWEEKVIPLLDNVMKFVGGVFGFEWPGFAEVKAQIKTWWDVNIMLPLKALPDKILKFTEELFGIDLPDFESVKKIISDWWEDVKKQINLTLGFNLLPASGGSSNVELPSGWKASPTGIGFIDDEGNYSLTTPQSNAKGLNYVPFDNYPTLLHRGEAVLNQSQGREWRQGGSGFNTRELYEAVASAVASAVSNISIDMDGKAVGNAVTEQVSRNIYRSQMGRRVGVI